MRFAKDEYSLGAPKPLDENGQERGKGRRRRTAENLAELKTGPRRRVPTTSRTRSSPSTCGWRPRARGFEGAAVERDKIRLVVRWSETCLADPGLAGGVLDALKTKGASRTVLVSAKDASTRGGCLERALKFFRHCRKPVFALCLAKYRGRQGRARCSRNGLPGAPSVRRGRRPRRRCAAAGSRRRLPCRYRSGVTVTSGWQRIPPRPRWSDPGRRWCVRRIRSPLQRPTAPDTRPDPASRDRRP